MLNQVQHKVQHDKIGLEWVYLENNPKYLLAPDRGRGLR